MTGHENNMIGVYRIAAHSADASTISHHTKQHTLAHSGRVAFTYGDEI